MYLAPIDRAGIPLARIRGSPHDCRVGTAMAHNRTPQRAYRSPGRGVHLALGELFGKV